MSPLHMNAHKTSQEDLQAQLSEMGVDCLTYKAGQTIQYQHQQPRGAMLLVEGNMLLIEEESPMTPKRCRAQDGPHLLPDCSQIDQPLPWTIQAETDCSVWFFSRFICQKGVLVRHGLHEILVPGSSLYQLWSHYVSSN